LRICLDTTILIDVLKDEFLSDFYIGGFASAKCDAILTRDRGIYRKYFPGLAGYSGCLS